MFENSIDMIINVGSMELLNIPLVLKYCYKVLKQNGIFLLSFQWDNGTNSTEHQNIKGIKGTDFQHFIQYRCNLYYRIKLFGKTNNEVVNVGIDS